MRLPLSGRSHAGPRVGAQRGCRPHGAPCAVAGELSAAGTGQAGRTRALRSPGRPGREQHTRAELVCFGWLSSFISYKRKWRRMGERETQREREKPGGHACPLSFSLLRALSPESDPQADAVLGSVVLTPGQGRWEVQVRLCSHTAPASLRSRALASCSPQGGDDVPSLRPPPGHCPSPGSFLSQEAPLPVPGAPGRKLINNLAGVRSDRPDSVHPGEGVAVGSERGCASLLPGRPLGTRAPLPRAALPPAPKGSQKGPEWASEAAPPSSTFPALGWPLLCPRVLCWVPRVLCRVPRALCRVPRALCWVPWVLCWVPLGLPGSEL